MTKRTIALIFTISLLLTIIFLSDSCKKEEDDPGSVPKKKYAWVTGQQDSTGYGKILFTPDGGETWMRQGLGSDALKDIGLSDIWAIDENNVWATGGNNSILHTTDGGQNWTNVTAPADLDDAETVPICIVDGDDIWIGGRVGVSGMIYRSQDGGTTWEMLDTSFLHHNMVQGLWAVTPQKIYVVGHHYVDGNTETGFISYTHDGGSSWDFIIPEDNYNKWLWIGVVSYENTVVIYGQHSHYMVSTDGGASWRNDSIPALGGGGGGPDINDLIMLDANTWWGALDMGHIVFTTDAGATWTDQSKNSGVGGTFLVGIDCYDRQTALVVSFGFYVPPISPILQTVDGGTAWNKKHESDAQLWKVSFIK